MTHREDFGLPIRVEMRWSIGLYGGDDPYRLFPLEGLRQPVLTAQHVTDANASFVADPFMLRESGVWYVFFEIFNSVRNKGEIALAESVNGRRWTYRRVVLTEPFHLSYPFVFKSQGRHYMIPETGSQRAVRLYCAADFPFKWEFVRDLITGEEFNDTTVFRHEDRWWMLTGTRPIECDRLNVYHAPDLLGPWTAHTRNPVVYDNPNQARPAGRSCTEDGRLIRYAQVDSPYYGKAVNGLEIVKLTPDAYEEKWVAQVLGPSSRERWNSSGMHHVDAHQLGEGRWLACVDGHRNVPVRRRSQRYSLAL